MSALPQVTGLFGEKVSKSCLSLISSDYDGHMENNTTTKTTNRTRWNLLCLHQKANMKHLNELLNCSIFTEADAVRAMQISAARQSLAEVTELIREMWTADRSLLDCEIAPDQAVRQCVAARAGK